MAEEFEILKVGAFDDLETDQVLFSDELDPALVESVDKIVLIYPIVVEASLKPFP